MEKIAVIGLGYVGLPVALAFAREYPETIGFDVSGTRVAQLRQNMDITGEVAADVIKASDIHFTSDSDDLKNISFYVVTVPTPINDNRQPDLEFVRSACEVVGKSLEQGAVVVFESTVYPGVTEGQCGPWLEKYSGLKQGRDFKLGYSPERINPGDKAHTLENIVKVVSAEDGGTVDRVANAYGKIIKAGIHVAPSIMVAEAAKVFENTQRDVNIALMNEFAEICDRVGVRTYDVLEAAQTKWNFLPFKPGVVGGHCIGIDPYYLIAKSKACGYTPQIIQTARLINDEMGAKIARKTIQLLAQEDLPVRGAKIGILGLTFKPDVTDIRNSRVPEIYRELQTYEIFPQAHDPLADSQEALDVYGIDLVDLDAMSGLDALIIAVDHQVYKDMPLQDLLSLMGSRGLIVDVKSIIDPAKLPEGMSYWSL